jgi:hypothetical protein
LHRRVRLIEVEVARLVTRRLRVASDHVVTAHELGHAGQSEQRRDVLETAVRVDEPGEVDLARTDTGHLPVEDGGRREVLVDDVADARVAPADDGSRLVRPVSREPVEALLDERRPPDVGRAELVPGAGVRDVAAQGSVAGLVEVEKRRHRHGMQPC